MSQDRRIKLRFHQLLNGNFEALLLHWARNFLRQRARVRKLRKDTSDARTSLAVKKILSGDVGRGLRMIDGHGYAPSDDLHHQSDVYKTSMCY